MSRSNKCNNTYKKVKKVENFDDIDIESDENKLENDNSITYYEESSESEPELECNHCDDSKIILKRPDSESIPGFHLMPTCERDPEIQPKKKQKVCPELNENLKKESFIKTFKNHWKSNSSLLSPGVELITDPFKVCVINNFLLNENLLNEVRQEFYELDFNMRSMDLYEFFQSKDLKFLKNEQLKNIYDFLKDTVMKWVANLTGLNLTHISATCSLYSNTDYLLVHDDQREDRLVAFVLYLTGKTGWNEEKGGALHLLSKDKDEQPFEVVRSIFPANNQLVFFPVTTDSYHQVGEVTSIDDCRLSINGWFHTKIPPVFKSPVFKPMEYGLYSSNLLKAKAVDIDLDAWINDDYLEESAIQIIQKYIEENSEISLKNFFKEESFNEVLENLQSNEVRWIKIGPPNRYSYEIIDTKYLPHSINRFLYLFQSDAMFSLLQKYTDLELTTKNASVKFEVQRWKPGSYSLLTDYDWQERNELDLIMYFNCEKSSDVIGARTQYVTIEDEIQNALITIEPEQNNLNIVYRDSARFTKYFSKQSRCQCFYTLVCSYAE